MLPQISSTSLYQSYEVIRNLFIIDDSTSPETPSDNAFNKAEELINKMLTEKSCNYQSHFYDYLKSMEANNLIGEKTNRYQELLAQAFIMMMGKELTPDLENSIKDEISNQSDWFKFIEHNRIHYTVQRQNIGFHNNLTHMIPLAGEWHNWNDLIKKETENGFEFYNENDDLLFSTDKNLKLAGSHYAGTAGIINSNADDFVFYREPTGKYWVTVQSVIKNPAQLQSGDSCSYLAIEDHEGKLQYTGQVKLPEYSHFLTPADGLTHFTSASLTENLVKEVKIEITKEEYERLNESIKKDQLPEENLTEENSTAYIRKKLQLIGLNVKTSMTFQSYLFRTCLKVLPQHLQNKVIDWTNSRPSWVEKVVSFNPIFYPITILATLVAIPFKLSSASVISFINAIFCPWRVTTDHPVALFESLEDFQKEQKNYTIVKATAEETNLGNLIEAASNNIGLNIGDARRLRLDIPQHYISSTDSVPTLLLKAVFKKVTGMLKDLFSIGETKARNAILTNLNTLMNLGYLSPFDLHSLRDKLHNKELFAIELSFIISSLQKRILIDVKSFAHLNALLKAGNNLEAVSYLTTLAFIENIKSFHYPDIIEEITSPEERQKYFDLIKMENTELFNREQIDTIQILSSRVYCFDWVSEIDNPETKESLSNAIKANDSNGFKEQLKTYYQNIAEDNSLSIVERKIAEEISKSITNNTTESSFTHFSNLVQTHAKLQTTLNSIEQLRGEIENLDVTDGYKDLKRLYENMGVALNAMPSQEYSKTFSSFMYGKIKKEWEDIGDILEGQVNQSGKKAKFWPKEGFGEFKPQAKNNNPNPINSEKKKKLFFTYISRGNGHRAATEALIGPLHDKYKISTSDFYDEIWDDPVTSIFGKKYSSTRIYNTLRAGSYDLILTIGYYLFDPDRSLPKEISFKAVYENLKSANILPALRIIKEMIVPTPKPEDEDKTAQKDGIRCRLLQERPDIVIAAFPSETGPLLEVAKELGLPFANVATDMIDPLYNCLIPTLEKDPDYPHKQFFVPYPIPETKELYEKHLKDSDITYMGYPLRTSFMKQGNMEELKKKYNIKDGQRVVVCTNGGFGSQTPWPSLIANAQNENLPPIKLIVLCGKNKEVYDETLKLAAQNTNDAIEIDPRGFTNGEVMAEICQIADLVVTKPGGSTLAENILMKNRLLLDTRSSEHLPWEKSAADAVINRNIASRIESEDRFIEQLIERLGIDLPEAEEFHQFDGKTHEIFATKIQELIENAEDDENLQKLKIKNDNLSSQLSKF